MYNDNWNFSAKCYKQSYGMRRIKLFTFFNILKKIVSAKFEGVLLVRATNNGEKLNLNIDASFAA
jgi:hypothetical protein